MQHLYEASFKLLLRKKWITIKVYSVLSWEAFVLKVFFPPNLNYKLIAISINEIYSRNIHIQILNMFNKLLQVSRENCLLNKWY